MAVDRHRSRDMHPRGVLPEPSTTPIQDMHQAAELLERFGSTSSEARAVADRLRRWAQALTRAARAERELERLKATR